MDIQKLGPYFDKFSRLADNDGFIDEESNKESYDEILAKIPDQKRREEVAQDKSIDFYEYLEATSAFSQAAIRGNRTLILSYLLRKHLRKSNLGKLQNLQEYIQYQRKK